MIEVYNLFQFTYPNLTITLEQFCQLFNGCEIVGSLQRGIAMIRDNSIVFLAVPEEEQSQGLGTHLLNACEQQIRSKDYNSIEISGAPLCGATNASNSFFEKNGYTGKNSYVEMGMEITRYCPPSLNIPDDVSFNFYKGSLDELKEAVAQVDEEWVQYFTDIDSVFCGYQNGNLASFCIIGTDELCLLSNETNKVGSVGCVGTLPQYRKQGIGLAMVSKATEYLRDNGCTDSFIHYTHLESWYSKLGYKTFLRFQPMYKAI